MSTDPSSSHKHLLQQTFLEGLRLFKLLRHQINFGVDGRKEISDFALFVGVG